MSRSLRDRGFKGGSIEIDPDYTLPILGPDGDSAESIEYMATDEIPEVTDP